MKKIVALFAFCSLLATSSLGAFELEDFNGSPSSLDEHIGNEKWTLVMFWAHDCGICRAEFPAISEFHERREDVDVIGISIDGDANKQLAEGFLASTQPSFASFITSLTLAAANYRVLTQEDFRGTPTFLLFTPDGELIGNNPGRLGISALEGFIASNSQ